MPNPSRRESSEKGGEYLTRIRMAELCCRLYNAAPMIDRRNPLGAGVDVASGSSSMMRDHLELPRSHEDAKNPF